jgi:hypothetical protein
MLYRTAAGKFLQANLAGESSSPCKPANCWVGLVVVDGRLRRLTVQNRSDAGATMATQRRARKAALSTQTEPGVGAGGGGGETEGESTETADDADNERECWICYEGSDEGELIAPCSCRGSLRWVHKECLQRWITTRVVSTDIDVWVERGRQGPNRFACPNCETPFRLVRTQPDDGSAATSQIWPPWRPWPRIHLLKTVDAELAASFQKQFLSPLACTAVHVMLLIFTAYRVSGRLSSRLRGRLPVAVPQAHCCGLRWSYSKIACAVLPCNGCRSCPC